MSIARGTTVIVFHDVNRALHCCLIWLFGLKKIQTIVDESHVCAKLGQEEDQHDRTCPLSDVCDCRTFSLLGIFLPCSLPMTRPFYSPQLFKVAVAAVCVSLADG